MSAARIALFQILQAEFKNEAVKERCCSMGEDLKQTGKAMRIFDKFPSVLPAAIIYDLAKMFQTILTDTKLQGAAVPMLTPENKTAIIKWQKKIIEIGCAELLDEKREVLKLLGWDKKINPKNIVFLICAYVGAVNQEITKDLAGFITERLEVFTAVSQFSNENYFTWVVEVLEKRGFAVDLSFDKKETLSQFRKILLIPGVKPAIGIGIGLGVLAALTAAATLLFKANDSAAATGAAAASGNPQRFQP